MNNNDTHSRLEEEKTQGATPHTNNEDPSTSSGYNETALPKKFNKEKNFVQVLWDVSIKYLILLIVLLLTAVASFVIFFKPTKSVSVPNVVGKDFIDASMLLQERDLYVKVTQQFTSDPSDIGTVINQTPQAGTFIRSKRSVLLTVSNGTVISEIPDLIGVSLQRADDIIYGQFSGFNELLEINNVNKIFSEENPGYIVAQSPLPGTKINNTGTQIDLIVSRGMADNYALMLDVEGLYFDEVFDYLSNVGVEFEFYISELSNPTSIERGLERLESGIILEQAPIANTPIMENSIIRIGVRGPTIQKEGATPNTISPQHNDTLQILSIPVNNVEGTIFIRKTIGEESVNILTVQSHNNIITLPYKTIPDEIYEAMTENEEIFWKYSITQKNSE